MRTTNSIEASNAPQIALRVLKGGKITFIYNGIFAMSWAGYYLYEDSPGWLILTDDEYNKSFLWDAEKSVFAQAVIDVFHEIQSKIGESLHA
jgi:hypothetical protein